jgi:hypothetical protein
MLESIAGLTLHGYSQDRSEASPGEQMQLAFFWEKAEGGQSATNQDIALELFDEGENQVQSWMLPPVRSDYPPSDWQVGERVLGQHALRLPANLETGTYKFNLEGIPLDSIHISAPERLYKEPLFTKSVGAKFSDVVELLGLSIESEDAEDNTELTISLIWRGLAEMAENYRVFIHLLNEDEVLLDQSDAEPAAWTRPTPGWVIGEYIIDQHQLILPTDVEPTELTLRIGLYDSLTGTRLPVEGADSVNLTLPNQP